MKKLWELFSSFFRIGLFTFGGGLAMIPLIQREAVYRRKWITDDTMTDIIAIAESTPGVIAVNAATFVGYKVSKFWGSFFATLGVVLPSVIIVSLIAMFFDDFITIPIVVAIFKGIRVGVTVLIFNAGLKILNKSPKTFVTYMLVVLALIVSLLTSINPIFIIIIGGIVGAGTQALKSKGEHNVN